MQRYDNPILQLAISAWLTARYNSRHDFLSTTERDRVRFLLFCSIWTTFLSPIFPVVLSLESLEVFTSVAAHLILFVPLIMPLILLIIRSTPACSYRGCSGSQGQRLSRSLLVGGLTAGMYQVSGIPPLLTSISRSHHFVFCGQLNALEAFAWIEW